MSAVMPLPAIIVVITVVAVIVVITVIVVIAVITVVSVVALNAPIFALVMPPVVDSAAVIAAENLSDDTAAAIAVMVITILRVSGYASGNDKSRAEGDTDRDALDGFCRIFHFYFSCCYLPKRERRALLTNPSGDAGESARCLFAFPNRGTPSGNACLPFIPPVYSLRARRLRVRRGTKLFLSGASGSFAGA